jgi:hypothetical protein
MLHRVETLRGGKPAKKRRQAGDAAGIASPRKVRGGTFHAVGARPAGLPQATVRDARRSPIVWDVPQIVFGLGRPLAQPLLEEPGIWPLTFYVQLPSSFMTAPPLSAPSQGLQGNRQNQD